MRVTTFARFNASSGHPVTLTWARLIEILGKPLNGFAAKSDVPLWSPAEFEGNRRSRDRVLRVHALGFDDDIGATWEEALVAWGRFAGALHTSWSDSPEKPARRAILALSRPITACEYDVVWGAIARDLKGGGHPVAPVKDPSRQWYRPAIRPGGGFCFAELTGEVIDVDAILAAEPAPQSIGHRRGKPGSTSASSSWFGKAAQVDGLILRQVGDDRVAIICPFTSQHSERQRADDTSCVIWAPTGDSNLGYIHCSHAHCADRTLNEWRGAFSDTAAEAADKASPPPVVLVQLRRRVLAGARS